MKTLMTRGHCVEIKQTPVVELLREKSLINTLYSDQ